ncbi:SEC14-like protein 2 [Folsomia candida]|uniref:CRAL-TRIO domain-containing protein n=1 Tax=Folsomia candida TaxID=158441 RepID=A0A226F5N5_FOLCA|nr:SEC14-like protein 2 [Folsomia candida]OXA64787.1 hypothetical protein Fcan01_00068 [Folsomia candida]
MSPHAFISLKILSFVVFLIFYEFHFVSLIEVEEELRLTEDEHNKLEMLKMRVGRIRAQDWLKTDLALLRWLRFSRLNVAAAETAFKDNLKWRKINKIDSILREDWSYWEREYYFDCSATDYTGRPVCTGDMSTWDIRQAIVSGKGDELFRYMIKTIEDGYSRVRTAQAMGLNVTQSVTILNMNNFNLVQHGCVQCVALFGRFITAHDKYYPYGTHKVIVINAPRVFEVVLNIVKPLMSKDRRDAIFVFGTNEAEWKADLLSNIPENELTPNFGGTKII